MKGPAKHGRAQPKHEATTPTISDSDLSSMKHAEPRSDPWSKLEVGRYQIRGELGRGGMGVVLEAYDPSLDRRVALKILSTSLAERQATRLIREAQALARLSHPNVVAVYEVGTLGGQGFIAMELVDGQSLRQWQQTPRSWRELLDAYLQAGQGLAAAHAQGLLHRDFKPSNCLIDATDRVRVADFGLAGDLAQLRRSGVEDHSDDEPPMPKASSSFAERLTRPGAVLGTLAYMSPEQRASDILDARSDQYSFCVSMHEALSQIQPARRVPRSLGRVLARGMATDPSERWPSMAQLLRALARGQRSAGRKRWVGILLGTNLGLLATLWALRDEAEPPCRGARERLVGIWDEDRAKAVEAAIAGTGLAYARDTQSAVHTRLSRYADAWVRTYDTTCEATHVRDELSLDEMDQRMQCLEGRRQALGHAVDELVTADAVVVEQAITVVTGLPSLSRCVDTRALQTDLRPPPEFADTVATLRIELDRARTRLAAGKYDSGLRQAEDTLIRTRDLGYEPLHAEARLIRGQLYQAMGRYEDAAVDLRAANTIALRNDHAEVAAEASASLTFVVGVPLAQPQSALLLGESALALAQRVDPGGPREAEALLGVAQVLAKHGDDREAERHLTRALELLRDAPNVDPLDRVGALDGLRGVLRRQGRHMEAERHAREALTLVQRDLGPDHPAMVQRLANLAAVLVDQGHHQAAEQELRQALEIGSRVLPQGHPALAHAHGNLGAVLLYRGRHDEAIVELERALQIWLEVHSPEHDRVADVLANLGVAARGSGDPEQARSYYQRALAQYGEIYGDHHPKVAMVELNLGKVLGVLGHDAEAAVQLERAAAAFEGYGGPEHVGVAKALDALGLLAYRQERYAEAHAQQLRALEIFEGAYGAPDAHPRVARALWALGRTELRLDHLDQASARLERALQIQSEADVRAVDRARTEQTLAALRWKQGREPEVALALARQALRRVQGESGDMARRTRDELRLWLDAHSK